MNPTRKTTQRIHTAGQSAIDLADRMFVAITNAHAAASDPKSLSERPVAEDAGIRGKGGHSDPTADMAIAGIGIHERVFELMLANIATLELAVSNLTQFCEQWAPERTEQRRCGEYTPRDIKLEEWYTTPNRLGRVPVSCQSGAWYDTLDGGKISWRPHGLCSSCYSLRRDWQRRQESSAA